MPQPWLGGCGQRSFSKPILRSGGLLWLGEVVSARAYLEQSIALYDPQEHRALAFHAGIDPGVWCLSLRRLPYGCSVIRTRRCGGPESARPSPGVVPSPSLAAVLAYVAFTYCLRREARAAQEAGRGRHSAGEVHRNSRSGWRLGCTHGAGHWPCRGRERRGWRRCARPWQRGEPWGQGQIVSIFLPY